MNTYDIAIIGAGPAGSIAAAELAQAGFKVVLVEQARCIGKQVQCAEFVPRIITRYASLGSLDIAQLIEGIQTWIQGEMIHILKAPGYTLHRSHWDKQLADTAVAAGAELQIGTRAVGWQNHSVLTLITGRAKQLIHCQWVLGCDGPGSIVSSWIGNPSQTASISLQYEMGLTKPLRHVAVHFDPRYFGGYAWVFPKGDRANVGIGIHCSYTDKLEQLLGIFCNDLINQQVLPDFTVYSRTAGRIPCGGLVESIGAGNILLAGDAAGCTHPVTGGGILNAVISGQLAANHIVRHFYNEPEKIAANYKTDIRKEFGSQLEYARHKAVVRDGRWMKAQEEFAALIRSSWVAFPEYYMR